MGGVFISYRRADSQGSTGRLADGLGADLGKDAPLFYDIRSIRAGEDFKDVIESTLAQCDVTLVMIGTRWVDLTDDMGQRRLDDPADLVRLEVEHSLRSPTTTVIPVLVDGASMPSPDDLPESIRGLASINAAELTPRSFANDVELLARRVRAEITFERPTSALLSAASVLVLLLAVALSLALGGFGEPELDDPIGSGTVSIAGTEVRGDDAIAVELADPIPITVTGVDDAAEVQLSFAVAGVPLGSTAWGEVVDGVASVEADVTEFTASGAATGEVRVRDADELVVATRSFVADVDNAWWRTALGLGTVLIVLAGFAYLESGLRALRTGAPSFNGYASCVSGGVMLAVGLVFANAVFRSVHVGVASLLVTALAVAAATIVLGYLVVSVTRPQRFAQGV
ncbi:MAG: toll/interleukin-1 receptor domain-containing protein [Actinomycetota bacterium]